MKLTKKIALIVFVLVVIGAIVFYMQYRQVLDYAKHPTNLVQDKIFTVPAGTGRVALENLLVKEQLIDENHNFQLLLKLRPELAQFKAGTYRLQPNMTIEELLLLIASGKEAQFSIRFIEGNRLSDWSNILRDAPYMEHKTQDATPTELYTMLDFKEGDNLEGWLYPDTYLYTAGTSDVEILKRAYKRMKTTLDEEWKGRDKDLPYKNAYEMLIMASIIEKETGVENERSQVASVFVNRLKKNMRLQTDPTVIYGLGDKYRGKIYRSDLDNHTPYNTYKIDGLPPTPIAMPGLASIKAAAHPAKTDYLYFVADGTGGHTFSRNLNDHNRAVKVYRQIEQQN
ncbi:putative aminodeoxychorismate lyase [Providencia rustigianii]|uniref:Endolytic murein transglycosylase n=1 Tax=Providencia rustigianii DSM 4541 TaxID=500637 RepID=D1P5A1_9GAMM|nr:endolytic transglycosylase MltG [Providencia rustigianii]EFB71462.1 YceG family protein [Providencia rustigianii DSM 4541]SPY77849.1 putative aminodeoxychorismate lyase [Providencia rustigianii]SUC27375.1 putative aminodeoxychorismate lyase [Providencia rustigianii]VEB70509.1 putative aminodeoxychorismate lyase [Providencia rustigianii]